MSGASRDAGPRKPLAIADYGLIGDCRSAALVGRNGAIDWLCWPRFDSDACFAALLGDESNGAWFIGPAGGEGGPRYRSSRRYRGDTMVLETLFETEEGSFAVIDFMARGPEAPTLVRIVEGRGGSPWVEMCLRLRFDYGLSVPWVTRLPEEEKGRWQGVSAVAGPNLAVLRTTVPVKGKDMATRAGFRIAEGERVPFTLSWGPSHRPPPPPVDADGLLAANEAYWQDWAGRCSYRGHRRRAVVRSLLTLKALTLEETGGMVAAPTASLPEFIGGERNWDYRYCWIRDATLALIALMGAGYYDEARAWRAWLHRSAAGNPADLQIMYGPGGERRLSEWELPWLAGYRGSSPVRIGNAASGQHQLDIWGELMDAMHLARESGLAPTPAAWDLQLALMDHLEELWPEPDAGMWEMRGPPRHFTHSKVMAWVAFDRSIRDAEKFGLKAPLARWRAIRRQIHAEVCRHGYDPELGSFTQSYGDKALDASLLLIADVGFLPIEDPRVAGTITAIERRLLVDGFVLRYRTEGSDDGLKPGEGVFLACSFWLADAWLRQGRLEKANAMIDRLLALSNDLGLLSEEYDTAGRQQLGNFPQAFSHLSLVRSALSLHEKKPVRENIEGEVSQPEEAAVT